jgi:hypothetical protein
MPPAAGSLQDTMNSAAAPLLFAAALVAMMLPLYALFEAIARPGTGAAARNA